MEIYYADEMKVLHLRESQSQFFMLKNLNNHHVRVLYLHRAECNCAVHKKCHDKVLGKCPGSSKNSRETKVRFLVLRVCACTNTATVMYQDDS